MYDFTKRRFDERILRKEDDGSAFEQFVDEYLRLINPNDPLVLGLAKGRDGAIDLIDTGQQLTQIIECKFIGASTNDTAEARWAKVEGRLRDNLPKAAAGNGAEKYRPWLNSQGNLQTYRFVTSAICASSDERNQLRKRIKLFLTELSQQHEDLSHLKTVTVEPIYWDDIVGFASTLVPLFYRWFGGFPSGYGEISDAQEQFEAGFKRFLKSRILPYFSREGYNVVTGKETQSVFETSLQHLITGNETRALVISGPGGIGKTRLSIEICEKVRAHGWWPIKLERSANVDDLDRLCASHANAGKILLFIDYAEAFIDLNRLTEAVLRLATDGNHRVAVLASIRSSSIQKITDQIGDIDLVELSLDTQPDESDYAAWVVKKILEYFAIPNADSVARSCSGLPVLAAFAAFLFTRNDAKFDEQFNNLAAVSDFSMWANRRLQLIEEKFPQPRSEVQRLLAELAAQLPMQQSEVDAFRSTSSLNRELVDILQADHWIEPDDQGLSAAHDVLADAMLSRHLFGIPSVAQVRLRDLLTMALDADRLDQCLTAIDRLSGNSDFKVLSGHQVIASLLSYDEQKTLAYLPLLIQSRLVKPVDIIRLLSTSEPSRERLASAPEAYFRLARTAEWVATTGRDTVDLAQAKAALAGPLAAAVAQWRGGSFILCCAHAFDPLRYQQSVLDWLARNPVDHDSDYLIISLLKWGAAPRETTQAHLENWLKKNAHISKASFVYKSWLVAGGEMATVEAPIVAWLAKHETLPEAQFVYQSWLVAGGEMATVKAPIVAWLANHKTLPEARFVYKSWLDAGGERAIVKAHIGTWLAKHETLPEAQFVYKSWLDAGGERATVKAHIDAWLAKHETSPDAGFVYKSWLVAGGERAMVKAHIGAWLASHETLPDAQFVYKSWLNAGGERAMVKAHIDAWLAKHEALPEAGFVYQSWLVAGGEMATVKAHIDAWLAKHETLPEAGFVYKSWLDAGGEMATVKAHIDAWLAKHETLPEAGLVYQSWLDAGGEMATVKAHIGAWLANRKTLPDAQFVYKSWLNAGGERAMVKAHIGAWLASHETMPEAQFVYKSWLNAGGERAMVKAHIDAWLAKHEALPEAGFVYKSWLDAGGEMAMVKAHIDAWLAKHETLPEAGFVYKSWLDAGGERAMVKAHIDAWLAKHETLPEAGLVYQSWLETGHPFDGINTHCEAWLKIHWQTEVAVFVTKALSKIDDLAVDTVARIVAWAGLHADHEDAIYRLSRMSRWFEKHPMSFALRRLIDRSSEAVIEHLLAKAVLSEGEKNGCAILFTNFAKPGFARDAYWNNVLRLFVAATRHGGVLVYFDKVPYSYWTLLLHDALEERLIDPVQDQAAIATTLDLIRRDMPEQFFLKLLSIGYFGTLLHPTVPLTDE